ncbi:hypothetical protein [Aquabacterium sp.]|uniref:hypothetical protein n=1 Tax=Aquabacterium sp. TaxID=1872578 RepID=UPI0040384680
MTTTPQAALLSDDEIERHFEINKSAPGRELRRLIGRSIEADVLAKLQATQAEPVHAGSASLLDGCKSIMDSIAVSSSVIENNRQEPVQAEPTLRDYADSLIKAGHDFWKACRREAGGGAVRWLSCDDGTLVVFTRGEYRDTIMENIGCYKAPEVFFEEDGITAAESKEPAQAGELPDERELFEAEMRCGEEWGHRSLKTRADGRYENWQVNLLWGAWQARAALAARKPLTDEQRAEIFRAAERRMVHTVNLSWRNAVVDEVERAHGIDLEVRP